MGAGCNAGQYEKVVTLRDAPEAERAPEHFVLFWGNSFSKERW